MVPMLSLSISVTALLALSTAASVTSQPATTTPLHLLHHRHSFISSLPVEPSDENFKVTTHQVEVVDLVGFREWEVKGSIQAFAKASRKSIPEAKLDANNNTKVHVQWYYDRAPLLRPPFTPTFIPGFHLAVTSEDLTSTWREYCPILAELIGAVNCQEQNEDLQTEDPGTNPIRAEHLSLIYKHHYVHRAQKPTGFVSPSSVMSLLISGKQHQSGSLDDPPALIDMVLSNGDINIKMIWPATGNSVQVSFNEQTDIAVEVGWFYREVTEQENTIYDHYLGATVKMEAQGEVVSEALLQTRSPVFPPHKREASTKEIKIPGHGFSSTMSPAQTLHPHSITTIQSNPYITDTTAGCELQVLHVLPPGIFVDPFQLEGLAPEIGEVIVFGETDLEKPVGVVSGWGSLVMVKVQPENSSKASRWIAGNMTDSNVENKKRSEPLRYSSTVDIPMHMRYQPPVSEGNAATHVDVLVPWPLVAWVCPVSLSGDEEASATAAKKLFHIPPLPLNLLFGFKDKKSSVQSAEEGYNFRFLLPDLIPSQYPVAHVSVPVGRLDDLSVVRTATFALAGAGTLAVVWALVKAVLVRSSAKGKMD